MKYPSWKDFESKYPDYQEIAFEALARMLFRCRYELGDSLPYFKNHAGNETETIVVDGEEIGFQAKYFDNEINASLIEHSIKTAHNNHPSQSKMIVYTNLEFGNPRKRGETKTEKQKNIELVAKDCNIQLEWMYGDNILDAMGRTYTNDEFLAKLGDPNAPIADQKCISADAIADMYKV